MNQREAKIAALDDAWSLIDSASEDLELDTRYGDDYPKVQRELQKIAQYLWNRRERLQGR